MRSFVHEQNQIREDYKYHRQATSTNIICGKLAKAWTFIVLFAICAPITMYLFTINQGIYRNIEEFTCLVQNSFRVSCAKGRNAKQCEKLACCYDEKSNQCYHYLPSKYNYYYDENTKEYVAGQASTPYNTKSIKTMKISVNELSKDKVNIILHDPNTPVVQQGFVKGKKNYVVDLVRNKLMVEIRRTDFKHDLLLSTTRGPLIASENYWEWSLFLTETYLFGLNQTLIQIDESSTLTKVIYKNKNDAHTLPIFWAYTNGKFHGVAIKHEGPLEINISPKYLITLKSLTGGNIELELSVGPTPKLLHDQQVAQPITPPPSWLLDTYVCRRRSSFDVEDIIEQFQLSEYAKSYCIDENLLLALMKNSDDVDLLRKMLVQLNDKGLRFFLAMPPHIIKNSLLYDSAEKLDILYKYNGSIYISQYMEEDVAYPDYSHANIVAYMEKFHTFLNDLININIDAFILNDNWPGDELYKINGSNFPYFSEELTEAMSYTIPWNATSESEYHMQKHNSYGSSQIEALNNYYNAEKVEKIIMSASKILGQVQPTFVENVETSWDNLIMHIDNILFNSITGNHIVGLPVCGDTRFYNVMSQETLCIRWYLISATMPLLKISSVEPWREPINLKTEYGHKAVHQAIQIHNMLVAHFHTILTSGEPVVRPMFYDFYENTTTFSITNQYMAGKNLLFAHPLTPKRSKLQTYLPSKVGIWYEFWEGNLYNTTDGNSWIDMDIRETDFLAFVAQGSIVPLKEDEIINLVIALNCTTTPCSANGTLLLENNVEFLANQLNVTISNINTSTCNYTLGYIKVYYYDKDIGYHKHYIKNENLCKQETSITIIYKT